MLKTFFRGFSLFSLLFAARKVVVRFQRIACRDVVIISLSGFLGGKNKTRKPAPKKYHKPSSGSLDGPSEKLISDKDGGLILGTVFNKSTCVLVLLITAVCSSFSSSKANLV